MSFPPPTALPGPARPGRIKPGKGWYWLGALLVAGGIIGGVVVGIVGVVRLIDTIDNFGRFKVENGVGAATVNFEKAGKYSIYYESQSKVCADLSQGSSGCTKDTVSGAKDPPPRLDISISNDAGALAVKAADHSIDYDFGDYTGEEVATVQVDHAGAYTMTVQTQRTGEFAVAIGRGVVSSILPWLATAGLIGLVGLALGLVTLIVTGVKRGRRKRAAAAALAPAYPVVTQAPIAAPPIEAPSPYSPPTGGWAPPPAPVPAPGPGGPATPPGPGEPAPLPAPAPTPRPAPVPGPGDPLPPPPPPAH